MAKSGIVKTNTEYDSYFWVKWEQLGNQDIANNRTQIKWSCGVSCGHNFYSNAIKMSSVSINGAVVYSGDTYSNYSSGEHTIATGTLYIPHNGDGTKTFTISAFTGWLYSNHNYSASATSYSLDKIPRQATFKSAPDFTDEQNPTITYSNPAGTAVTELNVCISFDGSKADIAYRALSISGSSYTFKLTEDERNVLRNGTKTSKSRTVQFILQTKIGSSYFYSSVTKTLSIVNANPTFDESSVTYKDTRDKVVGITENNQHIVQNQSTLRVTVGAASGNKGADISEYAVTVNGVKKTVSASGDIDFGKVDASRDTDITVVVKDSRGNTTTVSKPITILAHSSPVLNATVERLNNYEDETHLTPKASISSVNGKNTLTVTYRVAVSGGSFGSEVEIENNKTTTIICDKDYSHEFQVIATDKFGSVTKNCSIEKGKFPLFIDTELNAVGINEFPSEGEALRVAGGVAHFEDGIVLEAGTKKFKITVNESGTLVVTAIE